jgi:hypothetical protein
MSFRIVRNKTSLDGAKGAIFTTMKLCEEEEERELREYQRRSVKKSREF